MESVPDITLDYPITVKFYLNYGVTGRYMAGAFKDMLDKFHEIDRLTDARELLQDLEKPLEFKSLRQSFLILFYWLIGITLMSVLYLVYLFVLTEDLEEGLEAQFIYYSILAGMFLLLYLHYRHLGNQFEEELRTHVAELNKGYM